MNSKKILLALLTATVFQPTHATFKKNVVWNSTISQENEIEGTQIAIIELRGPIRNSKDIVLKFQAVTNDPSIKAVLLLIDSGGGSAGHSYSIFNEIKHCARKKPVIAFVEDLACSGAYLAACAANSIILSGGGSVGSVGVILGSDYRIIPSHYHDGRFAGEVEYDPITAGKFKDVLNPHKELTGEERDYLQTDADKMYGIFCHTVATERKIKEDEHEIWADGKVFNAVDAKELKLIDTIGSFTDALAILKTTLTMKGIKGNNLVLISIDAEKTEDKQEIEKK